MDPFLARTMVERLSKGIDPTAGLTLSHRDSCSNGTIQEALIEVLTHCSIESTEQYLFRIKEARKAKTEITREKNKQRYPRGGEPWAQQEESYMISLHQSGCNIYQIANILKRTPGAISDRMKKLQNKTIHRTSK